jgi:hypothetical protein
MRVVELLDYARIACRICLLAAAISALPAVCSYAADLDQTLKSPTPFVVTPAAPPKGAKAGLQPSPVAPNATGAEIVGKLLSNPPSDPDVPLPQGNLAARPSADGPRDHPTIFGRPEDGGGVFGLKIPIPADRGASEQHTRSSAGIPTGD